MIDGTVRDWLLDSDPTLRWQVERDLLGASPAAASRAARAVAGGGGLDLSGSSHDETRLVLHLA